MRVLVRIKTKKKLYELSKDGVYRMMATDTHASVMINNRVEMVGDPENPFELEYEEREPKWCKHYLFPPIARKICAVRPLYHHLYCWVDRCSDYTPIEGEPK